MPEERGGTVQKLKLTIAYDGTDFHGFQIQNGRHVRTVQGVLQATLKRVLGHPVSVVGAGRTDAGVHARQQVVAFEAAAAIPEERWVRLLNHRLPRDIVVLSAEKAAASFHPRFDAVRRVYRYAIETAPVPDIFTRRFRTHFTKRLNIPPIKRAAAHLIGTHDFTSFSAAKARVKHRVRTLETIDIVTEGTAIYCYFAGDGFLQHMVRIMTGTLIDVGLGKLSPADMPRILAAKDRSCAGRTMPPEGLTLWEVQYQ